MKFISVIRETHVSDKDLIAHLRLSCSICKQEEVIPIDGEAFLW